MSCCNECEQSGGNCNQGLGMLGQQGTVTIGSYVVAGTVIQWSGFIGDAQGGSILPVTQYWKDVIIGCMYGMGGFDNVQLSASGDRVTVKARAANDFAKLSDVFDLIVGDLYTYCGIAPRVDDFRVISVPAGTPNNNTVATPYPVNVPGSVSPVTAADGSQRCPAGYYDASYFKGVFGLDCQKLPDTAPTPDECDWNTMNWDDYIACQLGIKTKEAVIVGAVGALVGVIAISKLVK